MKIGIIYYSRTGNTKKIAKILEGKIKEKKAEVDLIEIEHVNRPGFFKAGRASMKQQELPIKNTDFDMRKYDVIHVGSPTWNKRPSPFIITFINKAGKMKGKKIAIFGTGMSPISIRYQFKEIIKNNLEKAVLKSLIVF